jgi:hypothetical protein
VTAIDAVRRGLVCALALALAIPRPLLAQPATSAGSFRLEQLEQIAAPIALYSDPLLAQVLMASTYPLEVVLADRFAQANPHLKGDALSAALQGQSWDDSVKALVAFPQILRMMSERLEWTQQLGDAFMGQQAELMDAVQRLRVRARAQGTLRTTEQQVVMLEGPPSQPIVVVQPASPQIVYVPMYSPDVVYGPWPYPAYPPYYYYPPGWPVAAFFTFGAAIVVGWTLWGICDWHHHHVHVHTHHYHHFTRQVNHEGRRGEIEHRWTGPRDGDRFRWEHDPRHRRGVDYRDAATRERFGRPPSPDAPSREGFRGRTAPGQDDRERTREIPRGDGDRRMPDGQRRQEPGRPERSARESRPGPESRPTSGTRPPPEQRAAPERRPGPEQRGAPELGREPEVFRGIGSGRDARDFSDRGRDSRQGSGLGSPAVRSAPPRTAPPPRAAPQGGQRGGTRGGGSQGGGPRR